MIAIARPDRPADGCPFCCNPFAPDEFTVTIDEGEGSDECSWEELPKRIAEIVAKSVAEFEARGGI